MTATKSQEIDSGKTNKIELTEEDLETVVGGADRAPEKDLVQPSRSRRDLQHPIVVGQLFNGK